MTENEESLLQEIYELERQKAMVANKCKQAVKLGLKNKAFAEDILNLIGVKK